MNARGLDFTGIAYLVAIGIVGAVLVTAWANRKAIATALNPADANNIANRATNSFVQAATGDANQTLGGWLYDKLHPSGGLAKGESSSGGIIRSGPASWEQQLSAVGGP